MTDAHGEPTRLLFTDLLGLSHGKTVPAGRADHPTHYAITVMVQGLDREFIEVDNYSTGAGFPDMEALLTVLTILLAWPQPPAALPVLVRPCYFALLCCFFWFTARRSDQLRGQAMRLVCFGFLASR